MKPTNKKRWLMIVVFGLLAIIAGVTAVSAAGAQVTRGDFHTFAAGLERGYDISGLAKMVRTADGRTLTQIQAWGLASQAAYPAHVHNMACAANNGGGHYQNVVGGPANDVNEIWLGFTANASGHGAGRAANDFSARPEAQSVVIHDTDGARIACADLE